MSSTVKIYKPEDKNAQLRVVRRDEGGNPNFSAVGSGHREKYSQKKSVRVCSEANPLSILSPTRVT